MSTAEVDKEIKWKSLKLCPNLQLSFFNKAMWISANTFIVVRHSIIYKCNTNNNTWTEWITLPDGILSGEYSVSLNKEKQLLYVIIDECSETHIVVIHLNTKSFKQYIVSTAIGDAMESIIINDKLHIIGGWDSNHHYIWNEDKNKLKLIHTFNEFVGGFYHHILIFIASINSLLLMGGYIHSEAITTDSIYLYSFNTKKWIKSNVKLPTKLCAFGWVLTHNQQKLIIFGGDTSGMDDDSIYILNLKNWIFRKSDIVCPSKSDCHALIESNFHRNDLLTNGFMRTLWKENEFLNAIFPANDIIVLIAQFYCETFIHLLQTTDNYWKIDIDEIL